MLRDPYFLWPVFGIMVVALFFEFSDSIFPLPGFGDRVMSTLEKTDPENIEVEILSHRIVKSLHLYAAEGVLLRAEGMRKGFSLFCYQFDPNRSGWKIDGAVVYESKFGAIDREYHLPAPSICHDYIPTGGPLRDTYP